MDVVWKGLLGGLVTALIVWASKRGDVLPGILPLAPTFAIIALLAVGAKGDATRASRRPASPGPRRFPAYLVFLGGCYLFIEHADYRLAILGGLGAWLAAALTIFVLPGLI